MTESDSSECGSYDESVEFSLDYDDEDYGVSEDDTEREKENKFQDDIVTSEERIRKMIEEKGMKLLGDETRWRESVRQQMESEINRRVREALETPPLERAKKRNDEARKQRNSPDINIHLLLEPRDRYIERMRYKKWRSVQDNTLSFEHGLAVSKENENQELESSLFDEFPSSNLERSSTEFKHGRIFEGIKDIREKYSLSINRFPDLKPKAPQFHTKKGFVRTLRIEYISAQDTDTQECTTITDKYGIARSNDGPFWPAECMPLFATPRFKWWTEVMPEPLHISLSSNSPTVGNQTTQFKGTWRGVQIAYDSDRSPRDFNALPVPDGCCPTLMFESRFECGNLRQARRVGQCEYELVLKSDLYTARHTQWYYFRVTNVIPGITYKLKIINLLKKDSLYNHGMRPLVYSERDAREKQRGWSRAGHHISYTRNSTNHNCPLLERGVAYHTLEWQMEFTNDNDTYYLAHCYPYSFTDLKEDLELLMNCEERSNVIRREVMCETRAGNSCFLLTITNFDSNEEKSAVVVTARVHPGESQSSWMMKGLLEFITGQDPVAQKLRNKVVFKVVPMINPDGVIVGNYRCSLTARDLNRNYRHPRQDNFPTIWSIKSMMQDLAKKYKIALYCDLHGHSRKPNVFMYGNNTSVEMSNSPKSMVRAFISERLFPWIMSLKSPGMFHFKSCKFHISRCKESTGRVVMWRQMRVADSYTLEATFSGTMLDRENCRHFNIRDFMDMGKILAEAILDYQTVKEDSVQYTQTVLGLTRVITEQVLASRGVIIPDTLLPYIVNSGANKNENVGVEKSQKTWAESVLATCKTSADQGALKDSPSEATDRSLQQNKNGSQVDSSSDVLSLQSNEDVVNCLQKLGDAPTLEVCLDLLAHLDVQNAVQESSSSDSDSESEPEMKPPEPKNRKKKQKSKRQREKYNEKRVLASKSDTNRVKSALPSLSATYRSGANNSTSVRTDNPVLWHSKQALSEKWGQGCGMPNFVSKYDGRHNGGVPCFTEERSVERAAKRIAELRRKNQDDARTSEDGFYYSNDRVSIIQEDLNQRLHNTSDERPNHPTMYLDLNIRTGYTHADNLKEIYPDNIQLLHGVNPHLNSDCSAQSCHHSNSDHMPSPTNSGKTVDKNNNNDNRFQLPLTARRTPYNQPDHVHPRSASDVAHVKLSGITSNSARSLSTNTIPASSPPVPLSSPTSINRLPRVDTSPMSSSGINLRSSLIVNSLSKTTSPTAKVGATLGSATLEPANLVPAILGPSILGPTTLRPVTLKPEPRQAILGLQNIEQLTGPATLGTSSSTNKTCDMSHRHKNEREVLKSEPVNLSLNYKSNKGQISLNNLTIKNNVPDKPAIDDVVTDTQSDIGRGGNYNGYHGNQEQQQSVGQLVNQLVQNLSTVESPLPVSKRKLSSRISHLNTLARTSRQKSTTLILSSNTAHSNGGIVMNKQATKILAKTKHESGSNNVIPGTDQS